ncbi:hypothetical protein ACFLTY_02100 [Chloroflexota bacterium]
MFNDELKRFEKEHPDVLVKALLDPTKPLPWNSPFAQAINQAKKNLVTIGQTSGRTEHHWKLHVLISAEIREHKLIGQTLLLA